MEFKDKFMTNSSEIIIKDGKEFHIGEDPCWTWRFNNHPGKDGRSGSHINVEKWKKPFGLKGNDVIRDIHIWYPE